MPPTPNPEQGSVLHNQGDPDQEPSGNTPEANQGNRVSGDGPGMGGTPSGPLSKSSPSDEQLTGGAGDNLEDTVQEERTGTTEGSTEDEPRNRMIAENQVDLDALSQSGSEAMGNRYGFSAKAAENFARDFRQQANRLMEQAGSLLRQADEWLDVASQARDAAERSAEEQRKIEEEKRKSEQKMEELIQTFQRIAEKMEGGNSGDTP